MTEPSTEPVVHHQVTELVLGWVKKLLFDTPFVQREPVRYDVYMSALPDAGQDNRWVPLLCIYLEMAGPDEQHPAVFGVSPVRPYALSEELIRGIVLDALNSMLAERAEAKKVIAASQNGGRQLTAELSDGVGTKDVVTGD
jgi:hypothetical protein